MRRTGRLPGRFEPFAPLARRGPARYMDGRDRHRGDEMSEATVPTAKPAPWMNAVMKAMLKTPGV